MSRIRKYATAISLVTALLVSSTAFAAPRRDDSASSNPNVVSRIAAFVTKVVKALDDIRGTLPPG